MDFSVCCCDFPLPCGGVGWGGAGGGQLGWRVLVHLQMARKSTFQLGESSECPAADWNVAGSVKGSGCRLAPLQPPCARPLWIPANVHFINGHSDFQYTPPKPLSTTLYPIPHPLPLRPGSCVWTTTPQPPHHHTHSLLKGSNRQTPMLIFWKREGLSGTS